MTDSSGKMPSPSGERTATHKSTLATGWVAARTAFGNALLAATGGIALMLAARALLQIATPAELLGDRLTAMIPLALFATLLTFFGQTAKHLYFGGLLIAQGVATAILASVYWGMRTLWVSHARKLHGALPGGATSPSNPRYWDVAAFAFLFWLISAGIVAPLIGAGLLGNAVNGGPFALLEAEIIPAVTTGLFFIWLIARQRQSELSGHEAPAATMSRRRVLHQAGFAFAVLAGTAVLWEAITRMAATLDASRPSLQLGNVPTQVTPPTPDYAGWQDAPGLVADITPTPAFYYVSKNLDSDPSLAATSWQLNIHGLVDHPLTLGYDQLRALPDQQQYQTLECISNDVGGNLMSSAQWTGTSLAQLLAQAGIQPGADQVIFRCADGYSDRLHLTQALGSQALVAYQINGAPLPMAHGFPARLLVPGLYGMKNGKWLTSLEVASGNYQGYWEHQGWSQEATIKMMSRIDVPSDGDLLPRRPLVIGGVAFSGAMGIGRVEVTTDGGRNWTAARLKQPRSNLTWVLWEYVWSPTSGPHVLAVRATDLAGRVQLPESTPPLPDGASGYHAISVTVS